MMMMKVVMFMMSKAIMNSITVMDINTMVTVTNLIFKASCPRLKLGCVSLFDRLEANPIRYRFVLRHLNGVYIIIIIQLNRRVGICSINISCFLL